MPFSTQGLLSSSSPLDGAEMVISGQFAATVSIWAALGLLILPTIALVLVGTLWIEGERMALARVVIGLLGVLISMILLRGLTSFELSAFGPGAWLTLTGLLLSLAAAAQWFGYRFMPKGVTK